MRHRAVPPRATSLDGELVVIAEEGGAFDGARHTAIPRTPKAHSPPHAPHVCR